MAVDGLRADLVIARAAAARAGLAGRVEADDDDVRAVAPLALAHRQRRTPFDAPGGNEPTGWPRPSTTPSSATSRRARRPSAGPSRARRRRRPALVAPAHEAAAGRRSPATGRARPPRA